jgi:hypothetical protein
VYASLIGNDFELFTIKRDGNRQAATHLRQDENVQLRVVAERQADRL